MSACTEGQLSLGSHMFAPSLLLFCPMAANTLKLCSRGPLAHYDSPIQTLLSAMRMLADNRLRLLQMQVFTSDHALKLEWVPNWVAIIGSGYIGLEFSDVYTALGSEVTFIEVRSIAEHIHGSLSLLPAQSSPISACGLSCCLLR
jgi:hypothetical protein